MEISLESVNLVKVSFCFFKKVSDFSKFNKDGGRSAWEMFLKGNLEIDRALKKGIALFQFKNVRTFTFFL